MHLFKMAVCIGPGCMACKTVMELCVGGKRLHLLQLLVVDVAVTVNLNCWEASQEEVNPHVRALVHTKTAVRLMYRGQIVCWFALSVTAMLMQLFSPGLFQYIDLDMVTQHSSKMFIMQKLIKNFLYNHIKIIALILTEWTA